MRAKPGDWLEVVGSGHDRRRARIEEVNSPDGAPPYRVRWLDTGREALVFPGEGAHVVTRDELDARNATAAARAAAVQHVIAAAAR